VLRVPPESSAVSASPPSATHHETRVGHCLSPPPGGAASSGRRAAGGQPGDGSVLAARSVLARVLVVGVLQRRDTPGEPQRHVSRGRVRGRVTDAADRDGAGGRGRVPRPRCAAHVLAEPLARPFDAHAGRVPRTPDRRRQEDAQPTSRRTCTRRKGKPAPCPGSRTTEPQPCRPPGGGRGRSQAGQAGRGRSQRGTTPACRSASAAGLDPLPLARTAAAYTACMAAAAARRRAGWRDSRTDAGRRHSGRGVTACSADARSSGEGLARRRSEARTAPAAALP
jgi:hypothetical protein